MGIIKCKFYAMFLRIVCCALFIGIGFSGAVNAQCKDEITIKKVRRVQSTPNFAAVILTTPKGLTSQQRQILEDARNWLVFNPDKISIAASTRSADEQQRILKESVIEISSAVVQSTIESPITQIEVFLTLKANLLDNLSYLVRVNNLAAPNCLQTPAPLKSIAAGGGKTSSPKTVLAKAKDRKDADIYIQGLAEGAHRQKTFFTVDALIKRRFRFAPNNFIEPIFELKTSTSKKADPDSASLGFNYVVTKGIYKESSPLSSLDFTNGIKLESDTDFRNVNFVYQTRADLAFRNLSFGIAGQPVDIIPFIGFELGRNLKSPVPEAKSRLLARPLFGANLYFQIFQSNDKVFAFETQYTRRLLLKREVAFKEDNGSFVALPINRKPRDYVKSSFNFDFTRNFGFSASYEYGQLPPRFTLVDSKFGFGLVFKGKFSKEEQ